LEGKVMKTFLVGVYSAVLVAAFGLFVFSGSWKTAVNEVAKTSTHDGEIRELAKTQQEIATAKINAGSRFEIQAVFMHKPGDYSIAYVDENHYVHIPRVDVSQKGGKIYDWTRQFNEYVTPIQSKIWADLKKDEPMYVQLVREKDGVVTVNIHIHSPREIGGAAWQIPATRSRLAQEHQTIPMTP